MDVFIRKPSKAFHKLRFGRRRIELYPRNRGIQKSNKRNANTNQSYRSYWIIWTSDLEYHLSVEIFYHSLKTVD